MIEADGCCLLASISRFYVCFLAAYNVCKPIKHQTICTRHLCALRGHLLARPYSCLCFKALDALHTLLGASALHAQPAQAKYALSQVRTLQTSCRNFHGLDYMALAIIGLQYALGGQDHMTMHACMWFHALVDSKIGCGGHTEW